jgi:hypothetical protein
MQTNDSPTGPANDDAGLAAESATVDAAVGRARRRLDRFHRRSGCGPADPTSIDP